MKEILLHKSMKTVNSLFITVVFIPARQRRVVGGIPIAIIICLVIYPMMKCSTLIIFLNFIALWILYLYILQCKNDIPEPSYTYLVGLSL